MPDFWRASLCKVCYDRSGGLCDGCVADRGFAPHPEHPNEVALAAKAKAMPKKKTKAAKKAKAKADAAAEAKEASPAAAGGRSRSPTPAKAAGATPAAAEGQGEAPAEAPDTPAPQDDLEITWSRVRKEWVPDPHDGINKHGQYVYWSRRSRQWIVWGKGWQSEPPVRHAPQDDPA